MPHLRQSSVKMHAGCAILAHSWRKSEMLRTYVALDVLALGFLLATIALSRLPPRHARAAAHESAGQERFFPDQRGARPLVEGTVARGQLHEDTYFYTGKIGSNPGDYMPFPVTKEVLERGRERYNIYCSPCHSRLGDGNGFIPSRGFTRASRRRITSRGCRKLRWDISTT